jgi:glycerophosphoryl diester phosphodiesterase
MLKIGHRGAGGYEPENTLRSFQRALELGVDMVEADVWLTKDKKIVIIHDATVNRTTNGRGKVSRLYLAEIKKLDAGWGEQVPTLSELLTLIKNHCQLNIEVKTKKVADYLVKELKETDFPNDNLLISSNFIKTLKFIKKQIPSIRIAWIFKARQNKIWQWLWAGKMLMVLPMVHQYIINKLKTHHLDIANIYYPLVNKKLVDKIHQCNKMIMVWTVNNRAEIKMMKEDGVDGIFSDYPDRI